MKLRSHTLALALAALTVAPATGQAAILPAVEGTAAPGSDTEYLGFGATYYGDPALSTVGDVNGDGRSDLAVGNLPARVVLGAASRAAVTPATAGRVWTVTGPWTLPSGERKSGVALRPVGDVTGDGEDDLLAIPEPTEWQAYPSGTTLGLIAAGRAAATTALDLTAPGATLAQLVTTAPGLGGITETASLGDLDRDGYDDLAVYWDTPQSTASSALTVLYGGPGLTGRIDLNAPGAKGFKVHGNRPASVPRDNRDPVLFTRAVDVSAVGDVNGDGFADLAVQKLVNNPTAAMYAFFIPGRAQRPTDINVDTKDGRSFRVGPLFGLEMDIVPLGDTDGDGRADVALPTAPGQSTVIRGRVATTDMGISTTFAKIGAGLEKRGPVGDVNGDGAPDVPTRAGGFPGLVLFGTTVKDLQMPPVGNPTSAGIRFDDAVNGVGDVDGDGAADLGTRTGIVYGYAAGTPPVQDTTAPVLSLSAYSPAGFGQCFLGTRYIISARVGVGLTEAATLELTTAQGGVTRTATIAANSSPAGTPVLLPRSVVGRTAQPVTLTVVPVDAAGNRGLARTSTFTVRSLPYAYACPGSTSVLSPGP